MSQPFHSADLQPVVRLAVLAGTICSPSHSLSHTHKHRYRTHAQTKTHGPAAWYMVPARGRQLHLSLSNLDPLAQQQLAPISSPLGPGFIKETVMDTAAWSRAASSSHHWQVTVQTNGMWFSGLSLSPDEMVAIVLESTSQGHSEPIVSSTTYTTCESHPAISPALLLISGAMLRLEECTGRDKAFQSKPEFDRSSGTSHSNILGYQNITSYPYKAVFFIFLDLEAWRTTGYRFTPLWSSWWRSSSGKRRMNHLRI